MKRTTSLVLVLAFIFTLVLQLPVLAEDNNNEATGTSILTATSSLLASSSLEKISTPSLINLYNQIKKIGKDLFGVKKTSSGTATSTPNTIENKINELKKSGLEKINSIDQVKLFDKVTKVGGDLFGLRKKGTNSVLPTMSADTITCVSSAIDAKDSSLNIALTNTAAEITAAIDARGICQKTALALSTGREDALKVCNQTFKAATKKSNDTTKDTQNTIWSTYKASLKTCSTTASTTEIIIEDGGEILK